MAEEAAHRIDDLADFGVAFDRDEAGNLALGREASHSHNRIIGIRGDRAGREIMAALFARAEATPSIDFIEGYAAYELAIEDGRVVGVFARPASKTSLAGPLLIRARAVILAMGGAGHLFDVTTNPHAANGEALLGDCGDSNMERLSATEEGWRTIPPPPRTPPAHRAAARSRRLF